MCVGADLCPRGWRDRLRRGGGLCVSSAPARPESLPVRRIGVRLCSLLAVLGCALAPAWAAGATAAAPAGPAGPAGAGAGGTAAKCKETEVLVKARTPVRRGPGLNYPVGAFLETSRCLAFAERSMDERWV